MGPEPIWQRFVIGRGTRIDQPSGSVSTEVLMLMDTCLIDGGSWWCFFVALTDCSETFFILV